MFQAFKTYCQGEEWKYFLEKKVSALAASYQDGFLIGLPLRMDTFWAECFELSKIAAHKRSREIGESKLKFQVTITAVSK